MSWCRCAARGERRHHCRYQAFEETNRLEINADQIYIGSAVRRMQENAGSGAVSWIARSR